MASKWVKMSFLGVVTNKKVVDNDSYNDLTLCAKAKKSLDPNSRKSVNQLTN